MCRAAQLAIIKQMSGQVSRGSADEYQAKYQIIYNYKPEASQVALVVKNLSANAGDIIDVGLIPG